MSKAATLAAPGQWIFQLLVLLSWSWEEGGTEISSDSVLRQQSAGESWWVSEAQEVSETKTDKVCNSARYPGTGTVTTGPYLPC